MVISRLEQRCRYCYGLSATSIEWDTKYSLSWKHGQNVSEPVKSLSDPHQSPFQSQRFVYMLERQQYWTCSSSEAEAAVNLARSVIGP